jgi:hypothetical protein
MLYEYKILSGVTNMVKGRPSLDWSSLEGSLNQLVSQGWEVVSSNASLYGVLLLGGGILRPVMTFVLRRPKQT